MSPTFTAASITACLLLAAPAPAQKGAPPPEPELALQIDFSEVEGTAVRDVSGHGYDATLHRARVLTTRKKIVLALDGRGMVAVNDGAPTLDVARRSLTVGAMCNPKAPDGVILSLGGATDGFSLYLRAGVPHFAVRSEGRLHTVGASEPIALNAWSHVAGVIGPDGDLTLVVNTMPDGTAPGALVVGTPAERLSIGADPGSPVAEYPGPMGFRGMVSDVRLYWGEVGRERSAALLGDWADRPMCGARQ